MMGLVVRRARGLRTGIARGSCLALPHAQLNSAPRENLRRSPRNAASLPQATPRSVGWYFNGALRREAAESLVFLWHPVAGPILGPRRRKPIQTVEA